MHVKSDMNHAIAKQHFVAGRHRNSVPSQRDIWLRNPEVLVLVASVQRKRHLMGPKDEPPYLTRHDQTRPFIDDAYCAACAGFSR
jgi:hypothetical protein